MGEVEGLSCVSLLIHLTMTEVYAIIGIILINKRSYKHDGSRT